MGLVESETNQESPSDLPKQPNRTYLNLVLSQWIIAMATHLSHGYKSPSSGFSHQAHSLTWAVKKPLIHEPLPFAPSFGGWAGRWGSMGCSSPDVTSPDSKSQVLLLLG